jgi:hypothetical protein
MSDFDHAEVVFMRGVKGFTQGLPEGRAGWCVISGQPREDRDPKASIVLIGPLQSIADAERALVTAKRNARENRAY